MTAGPLEFAQEYLARGWSPIPMKPGVKEPAVKFKHLAEQDFALPGIPRAEYLLHTSGAGVGILLRPSRLLCIDCDSTEAVAEAIRNTDEPCNNVVLSSKGAHMYYRRPDDCPPLRTVHRGASGKIDIMADGYMMAPPSLHPSGHRYQWLAWGPLQDAPAWAVGFLQAIRARSIAGTSLDPQAVSGAFPNTPEECQLLHSAIMCRDPRVAALLSVPRHHQHAGQVDRSHMVWLTLNTLIRLLGSDVGPSNKARDQLKNTMGDLPDETIAKVVWFGTLGSDLVGDKPRERGWQWFCDEIARARLEIFAR